MVTHYNTIASVNNGYFYSVWTPQFALAPSLLIVSWKLGLSASFHLSPCTLRKLQLLFIVTECVSITINYISVKAGKAKDRLRGLHV